MDQIGQEFLSEQTPEVVENIPLRKFLKELYAWQGRMETKLWGFETDKKLISQIKWRILICLEKV